MFFQNCMTLLLQNIKDVLKSFVPHKTFLKKSDIQMLGMD